MTGTIFKPPVYNCMVYDCKNEAVMADKCLCAPCYEEITKGTHNDRLQNENDDLKEQNKGLHHLINELTLEMEEAYFLDGGKKLTLNDLRTFYHEHRRDSAVEEEQRDIVIRLRNEINALNYNMDHAYNLGDGKFLTLDDLCTFYEDYKNIHDVVQQQLGLELKALQKPKEETFSTMPRQEFEKRAEAAALKAAENVKFDTYTEGFRKGFDMGYEKAKDQYYE